MVYAYSRHHTVTGVAHEHAKKIIPRVKKLLTERIDGDNHWNFDIKVDLMMIGSAEDVHESVDKAAKLKEQHQWDYVICLTDLPSISDNKVVISDYNSRNKWQCYLCHHLALLI